MVHRGLLQMQNLPIHIQNFIIRRRRWWRYLYILSTDLYAPSFASEEVKYRPMRGIVCWGVIITSYIQPRIGMLLGVSVCEDKAGKGTWRFRALPYLFGLNR